MLSITISSSDALNNFTDIIIGYAITCHFYTTYELYLPVTGKKIKYRPFLVKEEKILIIAMESEDEKQINKQ